MDFNSAIGGFGAKPVLLVVLVTFYKNLHSQAIVFPTFWLVLSLGMIKVLCY